MDGVAQLLLKGVDDADVLGNAAGHDHLVPYAHPVRQTGHPVGHGVVDTVDDVALVGLHGQLADDLALGEHSAGGADPHILGGLGAQGPQILYLHLQHPGHDVQEPAGTGGALVVHHEVGHHTVVDLEHLHILTADVDHSVDVGEQEGGALGVAAQLAHLVVGDLLQGVPAIAGGQGIGHIRLGLAGILQHLGNGPLGPAGAGAHRNQGLGHDLLAVFQHHTLGGGGPDVNS